MVGDGDGKLVSTSILATMERVYQWKQMWKFEIFGGRLNIDKLLMNGGFSKVESANTILNNFQYFLWKSLYTLGVIQSFHMG